MFLILFLLAGFIFLIKGADLLVEGSSSLAKRIGVSDLIIGLTIVAFGTSAPELIVNIVSALNGSTEIAIGNILGSNIVNTLLILGITSLIYPIVVQKNTTLKEIPFSLLAIAILGLLVLDSVLTKYDGLILLSFFIMFIFYIITEAKKGNGLENFTELHSILKSSLFILFGLVGLVLGGKLVVDNAITLAKMFNISESVIGLTIVAIGTSLPELLTSFVAAIKGKSDIAIGNVVGSNIFNIFWILGVTSFISNIPFSDESLIDVIVVIVATILLFIFMFIGDKHKINRWQGLIFLIFYFAYLFSLLIFR